MSLYSKAEQKLKQKYDIDILMGVVLARKDRAVYYVEFTDDEIEFHKIHGKSPMDLISKDDCFTFSQIEESFNMNSKYGEVAGHKYYKQLNLNYVRNMVDEANITIPIDINGQKYWIRYHLYKTLGTDDGNIQLASCYITDVTKYLIHEENLYEKTHKDELTGLFNRYTLYYHFELHGDRSPITSFYFDIDDFKMYNDNYGHEVGDKVLSIFSNNLQSLHNSKFHCYRLGGDEFYCLLLNSTEKETDNYATLIQDAMSKIIISRVKEQLSVSLGVVYTKGSIKHKYQAFMKEGDRLMYVSKKNGKNRITKGEFIVF